MIRFVPAGVGCTAGRRSISDRTLGFTATRGRSRLTLSTWLLAAKVSKPMPASLGVPFLVVYYPSTVLDQYRASMGYLEEDKILTKSGRDGSGWPSQLFDKSGWPSRLFKILR